MRQSSELCGSPTALFSMWNCDDVLERATGGGDGCWCTYRHSSREDARKIRRIWVYGRKSETKTLKRTATVVLFALLLLADDQDLYESNVFWYDGGVGGGLIGQ